ncbi:MAG: hypothetical protein WC277_12215 [Bacilli bacterium]
MTDAQSEIAMEMESHNLTPQQARQMALDHLHRAEAGREACRAKEAHECTCGTLDAYTHCQACGAPVCEQCAVDTVEGVWCVGCVETNMEHGVTCE